MLTCEETQDLFQAQTCGPWFPAQVFVGVPRSGLPVVMHYGAVLPSMAAAMTCVSELATDGPLQASHQ